MKIDAVNYNIVPEHYYLVPELEGFSPNLIDLFSYLCNRNLYI